MFNNSVISFVTCCFCVNVTGKILNDDIPLKEYRIDEKNFVVVMVTKVSVFGFFFRRSCYTHNFVAVSLLVFYLRSFTIACDGCQGDYIGSVHFLHKNNINTLLYSKHQFLTLSPLFIAILVQLKLCTTKFS